MILKQLQVMLTMKFNDNDDIWCLRMWWNDESMKIMRKRTHIIHDDVITMISHLFTVSKIRM